MKASHHALAYVFGVMRNTELETMTRRLLGEGKGDEMLLAHPVEACSPTPLCVGETFYEFDRNGKFLGTFTMKDGVRQ